MYDTALDDFQKRFGSIEAPETMKLSGMSMGADGTEASSSKGLMGEVKSDWQMGAKGTSFKGDQVAGEGMGMDKVMGAAGSAMDMAPQAMGLLSSFQGKDFDTSAEGGGVGNGRGAILSGAASGMQMGMKVGGPWGAAIGAVVGGGGTALAHGKAQKEYYENRKDKNLDDLGAESKELSDDYRMSKGLASVAESKSLLKRQLNIT